MWVVLFKDESSESTGRSVGRRNHLEVLLLNDQRDSPFLKEMTPLKRVKVRYAESATATVFSQIIET